MKKFFTIQFILMTLFFGCSPESNVTTPEEPTLKPQLIQLPELKAGLSVESLLTRTKYISGYNGGYFYEQFEYQSTNENVLIYSQLNFPSGAFYGGKSITQTFNTETASLEFGPAMEFNNPVLYTLTVSGLDLTGVNPQTLDFVYVAQDGSITGVVYDSITMDVATGTLKVTNARLEHFSRYGFVN